MNRQTNHKISDERERKFEKSSGVMASGNDGLPTRIVIAAALEQLIQLDRIFAMLLTNQIRRQPGNSILAGLGPVTIQE
ncbi:DUF7386 family protein [Halorubrum distributum]